MENPLVSVHMITYNHEPYIAQAIQGVLQQETYFPFELVIGEDCSTDHTREIVMEYQKKYPDIIRVITSEKNVGMIKNGLRTDKACRGKYIAYCEGDDYWHNPLKIGKQIEYLESHQDVGFVHAGVIVHNVISGESRQWTNDLREFKSNEDILLGLIKSTYSIYTATVCARKDIIEQARLRSPELFDTESRIGSTPLWMEVSRITLIEFMNEVLATYRVLPESACHSKDMGKIIRHHKYNYDLRLRYINKYNAPEEVMRYVRIRYNTRSLRLAVLSSDRKLANEAWVALMDVGYKPPIKERLEYYIAGNRFVTLGLRLVIIPIIRFIRKGIRLFASQARPRQRNP